MKIPKYIDEALRLRTKYAVMLHDKARIVDRFIIDHGLEDDVEEFDFLTGCEMYGSPYDSEIRIRKVLEAAGDHGG